MEIPVHSIYYRSSFPYYYYYYYSCSIFIPYDFIYPTAECVAISLSYPALVLCVSSVCAYIRPMLGSGCCTPCSHSLLDSKINSALSLCHDQATLTAVQHIIEYTITFEEASPQQLHYLQSKLHANTVLPFDIMIIIWPPNFVLLPQK